MAPNDMPRIDLDPQTAERLIDGHAGDLPPGAAGVVSVLEAARRVTTESDLSGMDATMAAMRAVLVPDQAGPQAASPVRRRIPSPLPRLVAASAAGFTVLFGGLAAAGALPSVAQNPVADFVSHVGIDLPRPANSDKPADKPGEPTTTSTTATTSLTGDTTPTTSATSETTVTAPACPAPSYEGPNGCITPLPVPEPPTTSTSTTTTTLPPSPTTTTSTSVPPPAAQGGRGNGQTDAA
jgi:hypothetical protein